MYLSCPGVGLCGTPEGSGGEEGVRVGAADGGDRRLEPNP